MADLQNNDGKMTLYGKLTLFFVIQQNGFKNLASVEVTLAKLFDTDVPTINIVLEQMEKDGMKFNRRWQNPGQIVEQGKI